MPPNIGRDGMAARPAMANQAICCICELIRVRLRIGEYRALCQQSGHVPGGLGPRLQGGDPQNQKGAQ
ncbi:hypothetical protein GCM10010341_64340 [Streptomyces noursei]|nr:hypothetical protein GCM10010341_64340 [Streptomyces noursei]